MNSEARKRSERLKLSIKAAGGNELVAARAGIGTTTISGYQNGKEWKLTNIEKLAEACGVSPQWLLFGDDERNSASPMEKPPLPPVKSDTKTTVIPGYDVELSAGFGFPQTSSIELVSFTISADVLPSELLQPHRKMVGVRARGDSMEPYICPGDIVVLDLNDRSIFTGGVYGLRVGDQLLVKRLSLRANGNLVVASDNPRYPTDEISAKELRQMTEDGGSPIAILGRVVWRMGMGQS